MKILTILAACAVVAGCTKPAETTAQAGADGGFTVERLFTHEGCTAYRFKDGGTRVYYTKCGVDSDTSYSRQQSCGKGCTTTRRIKSRTNIS